MRYIPNSPHERQEMLEVVGLKNAGDLFSSIPDEFRLKNALEIPEAMSEIELLAKFEQLAAKNSAAHRSSFLGAGAYQHYIPTIVDALLSRSEFFTSYTPYQPEISQGTLQYIFEFQTLCCQLTGMEVANASMYDASTGVAEAVLMAARVTKRDKVIVSNTLHPEFLEVVNTYVQHAGIELEKLSIDEAKGTTDASALDTQLDDSIAAVVIQSPNFYGAIEDLNSIAEQAHRAGALLIVTVAESVALGLLKTPGECDADIVVVEGQSFGVPLSFGGPYIGMFATKEKYARQMPGRLAGIAVDKKGRRGYVLTLATREQHIRREKATSNICTNQGLIALMSTIYMTTLGRKGLQEVAYQNAQKANYLKLEIQKLEGFTLPYSAPTFNEFVVRAPVEAQDLVRRIARDHNINAGVALSRYDKNKPNDLLICATEINTKQTMDDLVNAFTMSVK